MRTLLAIILTVSLVGSVSAGSPTFEIPLSCQKQNVFLPNGCCAWCAIETLGRHLHIQSLYGLRDRKLGDKKHGIANEQDVLGELDDLGISYCYQSRENYKTKLLEDACTAKLGCFVTLRASPRHKYGHAVILIGIDGTDVHLVDCNFVGEVVTKDRKWFNEHWRGDAVVIHQEENK